MIAANVLIFEHWRFLLGDSFQSVIFICFEWKNCYTKQFTEDTVPMCFRCWTQKVRYQSLTKTRRYIYQGQLRTRRTSKVIVSGAEIVEQRERETRSVANLRIRIGSHFYSKSEYSVFFVVVPYCCTFSSACALLLIKYYLCQLSNYLVFVVFLSIYVESV